MRAIARQQISLLSYEGARSSRRESGWVTGGTSANAEIIAARLPLRNRASDLIRNNPYAKKAVRVLLTNRIGTGILASPAKPRGMRKLVEAWKWWCDHADYNGGTDWYGIQALAEAARIERGECFVRFRMVEPIHPLDFGLRLQVLEADFLDTAINVRDDGSGSEVREGIEYTRGLPTAYYLLKRHPGDSSLMPLGNASERIPATEILHYYRALRPGQLTGVTELHAVITRLNELDAYADAERMRKRIAACSVAWVTTPAALPGSSLGPVTVDENGQKIEQFSPGMVHYGRAGEQVEFFDPKPTDGYDTYFDVELHAVAAGLDMPYELLTGDLSSVTYTSHRGGLVQFRSTCEQDQWQMIIPKLIRPVWDRFVREWGLEIDDAYTVPVKFTPPRFGLLNPAQEIPANIQAVQSGLMSWPEVIRRDGYEPEEVLDEIDAWQKDLKKRGVVLTSDARQNAGPASQRFETEDGGDDDPAESPPKPEDPKEQEPAAA